MYGLPPPPPPPSSARGVSERPPKVFIPHSLTQKTGLPLPDRCVFFSITHTHAHTHIYVYNIIPAVASRTYFRRPYNIIILYCKRLSPDHVNITFRATHPSHLPILTWSTRRFPTPIITRTLCTHTIRRMIHRPCTPPILLSFNSEFIKILLFFWILKHTAWWLAIQIIRFCIGPIRGVTITVYFFHGLWEPSLFFYTILKDKWKIFNILTYLN